MPLIGIPIGNGSINTAQNVGYMLMLSSPMLICPGRLLERPNSQNGRLSLSEFGEDLYWVKNPDGLLPDPLGNGSCLNAQIRRMAARLPKISLLTTALLHETGSTLIAV
ncbi:hypothetical protein BDZ89DRAFT_1037351 [Hymenopellis radicata]|nr:hypothetical protein BDZ89DRAFT_1037351 [Hymenopellis radicata]